MNIIAWLPLAAAPVYAASATLYLSPADGNATGAGYLVVNVRENSGSDKIDSVQANLSYPADLLDFISISSVSAFGTVTQNSGGNGSVNIARGAQPAVSGDQLVASVRFKTKVSSGTATVNFAAGSSVKSGGKDVTGATTGGDYSLAAELPDGAAADKIAPAITKVSAASASAGIVQVNWTTSEPATSEVSYGLSQSYNLAAGSQELVTDHKVTLKTTLLSAAENYHYMVTSTDAAGNQSSSSDASFKVKGTDLYVTVINQKNMPVKGAIVKLGGQTAVTNKNGQAQLTGLKVGKQASTVTFAHKTTPVSAEVIIDPDGEEQGANFKIHTGPALAPFIIGLLLLAVAAALLGARRRRPVRRDSPAAEADSTVVGPGKK